MKKSIHFICLSRFFSILAAIFMAFSAWAVFTEPVSAAGDLPRLVDEAGLLSDSEKTALLHQLDEISERQQVDLVVVTVDSLEGALPVKYADDFYDAHGYGFGAEKDGVLFLVSMEERDWYISTAGFGITAVTDAGLDYMAEKILDDLSSGAYAAAFTKFAEWCDAFITQARTGEPYDSGHLPKAPFGYVRNLLIAFGIGFVISLAVVEMMRARLKTVRSQPGADAYVKRGSMQLTRKNDLFLYQHIERRKRAENSSAGSSPHGSSTHTSSSGRTHGGGGGKF